jgi:integrase
MVPHDEETVALIDRIVAHRSPGRPLRHPRTARPTDYLFTHHGRRLTVDHLRDVLTRVTTDAGLSHITPHQLRHTYATALEMSDVAADASFSGRRERFLAGA